jgi:hypothetical protein
MKWRNGNDTASMIFLSHAVNVIWLLNVFLRMNLDLGYEIFVFVKKMNVINKCERLSHNIQYQIRSIFRCCQFANLAVISSFKAIWDVLSVNQQQISIFNYPKFIKEAWPCKESKKKLFSEWNKSNWKTKQNLKDSQRKKLKRQMGLFFN